MIICSCNFIDVEDIRATANYATEPNVQQVLNMLAWTPECSTCSDNLKSEIRKILQEITSGN